MYIAFLILLRQAPSHFSLSPSLSPSGRSDNPLAKLYTTSTMEHHHFNHCIMILNSDGNKLLQALTPEDYKTVITILENAILATDLKLYFQ